MNESGGQRGAPRRTGAVYTRPLTCNAPLLPARAPPLPRRRLCRRPTVHWRCPADRSAPRRGWGREGGGGAGEERGRTPWRFRRRNVTESGHAASRPAAGINSRDIRHQVDVSGVTDSGADYRRPLELLVGGAAALEKDDNVAPLSVKS